MISFTYSFCMTLLHSFWQAALLLLLYITVDKVIHRNNAPLAKRNILYATLAAQCLLSILTFTVYFFDTSGNGKLTQLTQTFTGYLDNSNLRMITPWIFSGYVFIIAYKLLKAIYSWFQFKKQFRTGLVKPPVELKLFTGFKADQFGLKRKITLWLSNAVHTPVTFGFFKPVILMPVALINNISTRQAETLILHELTHIRTNDYLLNWFLLITESTFFFNPFVHNLCKKIRLEREMNCDINVLAFEYSPALYAETLLQAERMKQLVPVFQLAAVNRKKQLLLRIQFFTNDKIVNQALRFNIVAPLIGLVLLLLLSVAVLFQSTKTVLPEQSAVDIQFLPFNNYITAGSVLTNENNRYIKTASVLTTPQTRDRSMDNRISKQPETVILPEPEQTETAAEPAEINIAKPIAEMENDAARRIIIKEESSGSTSVKVYYLSFENGKWILQPEWVLTARAMLTDSLSAGIDSLKNNMKRTYPAQQ